MCVCSRDGGREDVVAEEEVAGRGEIEDAEDGRADDDGAGEPGPDA